MIKNKSFKAYLASVSMASLIVGSTSFAIAQDTVTSLTGATNYLSVPADWKVLGVAGQPNNDPTSMVFLTQAQDLNFGIDLGNLGTINLYGFGGQKIVTGNRNSLAGIVSDTGGGMLARVTAANGGAVAAGGAGAGAKINIQITDDYGKINFTGNQLTGLGNITLDAVNSEVQFSGDNSIITGTIDSGIGGNGVVRVSANNVQFNGVIGQTSRINWLYIDDNGSAVLNNNAAFQAGGINIGNISQLDVATGQNITFNNNAQIGFNGDGTLNLQGDINRTIISNIYVNGNNNGSVIYEGKAGKTLELQGVIGDNSNYLGLIDITSGGALKLSSTNGSNDYINEIDMGAGNGSLVLNHIGLHLNTLTHANNMGTIIISDAGVPNTDAATAGISGNVLGTVANPLSKIKFESTVGGALVNVLLLENPTEIHAANIETDIAGKGVMVFAQGNNIIDAQIGTNALPLLAIAINNNTTVELQKDAFFSQNLISSPYEIGLAPGATVKIKANLVGDIAGVDSVLTSTPVLTTNGTVDFINTVPITMKGDILSLNNVNITDSNVSIEGNIETQTLNFQTDSQFRLLGNINRTVDTSNIYASNVGSIIANDMTAGKTLTIVGHVGDPSNKLKLIEAKGGGTVKFMSRVGDTDPRSVHVQKIDITTNDGVVEFNGGDHSGFILAHDNNSGTIVLNSTYPGSFTGLGNGMVVSSGGNRLKKIIFKDNGTNSLFNVLAFQDTIGLYVNSIETDTANTGVMLFGSPNNIIDAPIGSSAKPIEAIGAFVDNASIEIRNDAYLSALLMYAGNNSIRIKSNIYTYSSSRAGNGGIFGIDYADISTFIKGVKGEAEFINTAPVIFDGEIGFVEKVKISGKDVTVSGPAEAREFRFTSGGNAATLKFQDATTIHTNGATTAGNNIHNLVFEDNVNINANVGSLANQFNNITFSNNSSKVASLRNNIYSSTITANNSHLAVKNNMGVFSDINGNSTNLDFEDNAMSYKGNASLNGNVIFNTKFSVDGNGNRKGGHLVLLDNATDLDFSSANSAKVVLTASSPVPAAGSPYSYVLFEKNTGTITSSNTILESNETNRFVFWSYNPTNYVLSGIRNVTIVDDVTNNGGNTNTISFADALSNPNISDAALRILNEFGFMSAAEATEALNNLVPFDVSGTALAEAVDLAEKNNERRISGLIIPALNVGSGVGAGDEDDKKYGAWGAPFYSRATQKSFYLEPGYKSRSYGATVGADTMFNDNLTLGASLSLIHTIVTHSDLKGGDKGKSESKLISLYGFKRITPEIFLQAIGFVGFSTLKNVEGRNITSNIRLNAHSKYRSITSGGQLTSGKQYNLTDSAFITPMLGLRYVYSRDSGYKETGASIQNLTVSKKSSNSFEGIFGGKILMLTQFRETMIRPEFQAFVNYNFKTKPLSMHVSIDGLVSPVKIISNKPSKAWYSIGAGLTAIKNRLEYGVHYEAELDKKYIGHQGVLKLRVNF